MADAGMIEKHASPRQKVPCLAAWHDVHAEYQLVRLKMLSGQAKLLRPARTELP